MKNDPERCDRGRCLAVRFWHTLWWLGMVTGTGLLIISIFCAYRTYGGRVAIFFFPGFALLLFIGLYCWQQSIRSFSKQWDRPNRKKPMILQLLKFKVMAALMALIWAEALIMFKLAPLPPASLHHVAEEGLTAALSISILLLFIALIYLFALAIFFITEVLGKKAEQCGPAALSAS